MASSQTSSQTHTNIVDKMDPDGDVIFIMTHDMLTARLLVSSKVLSLASPPFAAMFSPRFREGSNLDPGCPTEIPFPEDNLEAMTILCNCLHFRTDRIPREVDFSQLKALAILCDKYDITKAISPWITLWLQKCDSLEFTDGFEELLAVIYVLDCAEAFSKMAEKAVLDQIGPFDAHRVPDEFEMVPWNLLVDLEVRRAAIQASLQERIEGIVTLLPTVTCANQPMQSHQYLLGLQKASLWPLSKQFRQSSIATIMQRLTLFTESNKRHCVCATCQPLYNALPLDIGITILSSTPSLCLDCVRAGRGSNPRADRKDCRIAHPEVS